MPGSSWKSSLAAEVLGLYAPGSMPIIRTLDSSVLVSLSVHELAHRDLCWHTTSGRYAQALALASRQPTDEPAQRRLEVAVQETVQQSWAVQEGFATLSQVMHFEGNSRPDLTRHLVQAIPGSYRVALERLKPKHRVLNWHAFIRLTKEQRSSITAELTVAAAFVLCKAAMSMPLSDLCSDLKELPSLDVTLRLRSEAADVRLERLLPLMSESLTARAFQVLELWEKAPLDRRNEAFIWLLDRAARDACASVGISYESAEALSISGLLSKMPTTTEVNEELPANVPPPTLQQLSHQVEVVAPIAVEQRPWIAFTLPAFEAAIAPTTFGKPLIVCELALAEPDGSFTASLHEFYSREDVLRVINPEGLTELSPEFAELQYAISMNADWLYISRLLPAPAGIPVEMRMYALRTLTRDTVYQLPNRVPAQAWQWIIAEELLAQWDVARLNENGVVNAFPLRALPGVAPVQRESKVRGLFAVASSEGLQMFEIPEGISLLTLADSTKHPGTRMVRLTAGEGTKARGATEDEYPLLCVGQSLYLGRYAQILGSLRGF